MKKFLELISEEMGKGFEAAGYEAQLGRVTVSNRPDLCEYQCNGAMAGAKKYHKAAPRRSSALRSHRRKHQADQPLQRT